MPLLALSFATSTLSCSFYSLSPVFPIFKVSRFSIFALVLVSSISCFSSPAVCLLGLSLFRGRVHRVHVPLPPSYDCDAKQGGQRYFFIINYEALTTGYLFFLPCDIRQLNYSPAGFAGCDSGLLRCRSICPSGEDSTVVTGKLVDATFLGPL